MWPIHKIRADSKLNIILMTKFDGARTRYVEVGPEKVILPEEVERYQEKIINFEVRDDDTYILSFPKTGSRWTQEMVWLVLNNLDFEKSRTVNQFDRVPMLELEILHDDFKNYFQKINALNSPRCIGSHLAWSLLPKSLKDGSKQPKMIVVMRGPEDTCLSFYHYAKVVSGYKGSFDDYCDLFLGGKVLYGSYWNHVLGLWNQKHKPNIFFLKYEEMIADLAGNIRKVAEFLERSLSDDEVEAMCRHLAFDNLKNSQGFNMEAWLKSRNSYTNPFIRRGIVGDHLNVMSAETIAVFKDQRKLYLQGTELTL